MRPTQVDGVAMSYALASGQINVQGTIKGKAITIATDQKIIGVPDHEQIYTLVYSHSTIAQDEIDVALNGALVKSISATSTDKSTEIAQGITSILSQTKTLQTALKTANTPTTADEACPDDLDVTYVKNITTGEAHSYPDVSQYDGRCYFKFHVYKKRLAGPLGFRGFPRSDDWAYSTSEICKTGEVFCFRLGSLYRIEVTATLWKNDGKNGPIDLKKSFAIPAFTVLAPTKDSLGYLRFDRRAFVANKASITFADSGLVSGFGATNPSEVLGFVTFGAAVGGVAAATVALQ
jgi:hypothetical protein